MKNQISKIKYQKYPVKLKLFDIKSLVFGFRRSGRKQTSLLKNAGGVTGVEFIIALVIVSLIVVVVYDVLRESINIWKFQDVQTNVVQQARLAMERLVREIRQAEVSSIAITVLDANRDRIEFRGPLELENPDDLQTVRYEPQLNGDLQRTVTYQAGGTATNVVATNVAKLLFNGEYEGQIAIRMQLIMTNQTVNMASRVQPRNRP